MRHLTLSELKHMLPDMRELVHAPYIYAYVSCRKRFYALAYLAGFVMRRISSSMTAAPLLRAILRHTNWTQAQLAAALGVKQPTVSRLLGKSKPQKELWDRIEQLSQSVGIEGLTQGKTPVQSVFTVVGIVGLGEEVSIMDGTVEQPLEEIELPFGFSGNGCKALLAKGDSQYPRVRSGEVVIFRRVETPPEEHVGEEMIVGLVSGTVLLKTLRRGSEPGLFSLESHNAPLRENQQIDWLGEIISIVPSKHWRNVRGR